MAELLQLDAAAALVGKSEVTLRRLVKSGKVKAHKEKTLTGFIYLIDKDEVQSYYHQRDAAFAGALHGEPEEKAEAHEEKQEVVPGHAIPSKGKMRLAVANETGNSAEYWLKRAEIYEEKYLGEIQKVSQMREELGIWRGRAEHSQAMLLKMLPAAHSPIEVPAGAPVSQKGSSNAAAFYVVGMAIIFIATAASLTYVLLK